MTDSSIPPVPPPVPTPPAPVPAPVPMASKPPSHAVRIAALSLFIFVAVALGGGYAFAYIMPQQLLGAASHAVNSTQNYHSDITFTVTSDTAQLLSGTANVDVSRADPGNQKMKVALAGTAFGTVINTKMIMTGDQYYLQVNDLPFLALLGLEVQGKWLSFSKDDLTHYASSSFSSAGMETPDSSFNKILDSNVIQAAGVPTPVWDANGPALRYTMDIDQEKYRNYIKEKVLSDPRLASSSPQYRDSLTETLSGITAGPVVYQISLAHMIVDDVELPMSIHFSSSTQSQVPYIDDKPYQLFLHISISNIGKPVVIEAPASSTPLIPFVTAVFNRLAPHATSTMTESPVTNSPSPILVAAIQKVRLQGYLDSQIRYIAHKQGVSYADIDAALATLPVNTNTELNSTLVASITAYIVKTKAQGFTDAVIRAELLNEGDTKAQIDASFAAAGSNTTTSGLTTGQGASTLGDFAKNERAQGKTEFQIKSELLSQGWNLGDINELFGEIFAVAILDTNGNTSGYLKDDINVYCFDANAGPTSRAQMLSSVDLASFELILDSQGNATSLAKDKNYVYERDTNACEAVAHAFGMNWSIDYEPKAATFHYVGGISDESFYAADKNHMYYWNGSFLNPIVGADVASFATVSSSAANDAKDKNHLYLKGSVVLTPQQ